MASKYRWASVGDINAFFGLMLDNVAGLLLIVSLLHSTFAFPIEFALRYMIPGTAIGVLVGDLAFFGLAFVLAKRTGSDSVTAMPLGLDTPSTFGMIFFVLGPAYIAALPAGMQDDPLAIHNAAMSAWQIGICSIVFSGILKLVCSFGSEWVRRVVPRAGLLGSLAAIALVLISFLPLLEILEQPLVGLVALAIVLTALVGRVPLPFKLPGAVGGLVVAGAIFAIMHATGYLKSTPPLFNPSENMLPTEWMSSFSFGWVDAFGATVKYLPIVIPFAIATVVGGIDCTESAAAAGDRYNTNTVIAIEAIATLFAGFCGAVIQTTPYIGHPAYKAMGGRAAYTLATAITIGLLGVTGLFGYFYQFIPKATVYPILVFVGLEIAAQSFLATPRRHYTAVAFACVPALAKMAVLLQVTQETILLLANGFILTSIVWASALAMAIDRRLMAAAGFYFGAAAMTLVGLMHCPLPEEQLFSPTSLPFLPPSAILDKEHLGTVLNWAGGYAIVGLLMVGWHFYLKSTDQLQTAFPNDEFDPHA
jgi:adenine/guanine/hypoxanthine permease